MNMLFKNPLISATIVTLPMPFVGTQTCLKAPLLSSCLVRKQHHEKYGVTHGDAVTTRDARHSGKWVSQN